MRQRVEGTKTGASAALLCGSLGDGCRQRGSLARQRRRVRGRVSTLRETRRELNICTMGLNLSGSADDVSVGDGLVRLRARLFDGSPSSRGLGRLTASAFGGLQDSRTVARASTGKSDDLSCDALLARVGTLILGLGSCSGIGDIRGGLGILVARLHKNSSISVNDVHASASDTSDTSSSSSSDDTSADSSSASLSKTRGTNAREAGRPTSTMSRRGGKRTATTANSSKGGAIRPGARGNGTITRPRSGTATSSAMSTTSKTRDRRSGRGSARRVSAA